MFSGDVVRLFSFLLYFYLVWQDKQGNMVMHPSMESYQSLTGRDLRLLGFHLFHLTDLGKPYSVDHLIIFRLSPNCVQLSLNPYWKREQLLLSEHRGHFVLSSYTTVLECSNKMQAVCHFWILDNSLSITNGGSCTVWAIKVWYGK